AGTGPDGKSKSWFNWPFGKNGTTTEEPPLLEKYKAEAKKPAPLPLPTIPVARTNAEPPAKVEPKPVQPAPLPIKAPVVSVAERRGAIQAAGPKAVGVEVELTSPKEARITVEIRTDAELTPTADRVFALPELQNYRLDL